MNISEKKQWRWIKNFATSLKHQCPFSSDFTIAKQTSIHWSEQPIKIGQKSRGENRLEGTVRLLDFLSVHARETPFIQITFNKPDNRLRGQIQRGHSAA